MLNEAQTGLKKEKFPCRHRMKLQKNNENQTHLRSSWKQKDKWPSNEWQLG